MDSLHRPVAQIPTGQHGDKPPSALSSSRTVSNTPPTTLNLPLLMSRRHSGASPVYQATIAVLSAPFRLLETILPLQSTPHLTWKSATAVLTEFAPRRFCTWKCT